MKKTLIHRENIVDSNLFCMHDEDIFSNQRWEEEWYRIEEEQTQKKLEEDKTYKPLMPINNSWNRNARQYKTKAAGAISQIKFDQVIAVCSEAFWTRVKSPSRVVVQKEPPIHLNYQYAVVDRPVEYRTRTTKSLYRRRSRLTNTNLSKRQKRKLGKLSAKKAGRTRDIDFQREFISPKKTYLEGMGNHSTTYENKFGIPK